MSFKRILSVLIVIPIAWYSVSAQIQKQPTAPGTAPTTTPVLQNQPSKATNNAPQPSKAQSGASISGAPTTSGASGAPISPARAAAAAKPVIPATSTGTAAKSVANGNGSGSGNVAATANKATTPSSGTSTQQKGDRKLVDFEADIMRPIKIGDSSVLNLLGNVVFYHNGAVITCDSALRYNDKRMECFKNVVVNKDQTYIYGDRADYNGDLNVARVYAPIIKMIDGDATMFTYNFSFNTKENLGRFSGGATISQKDNLLESVRGYYYTQTRDVVCVERVEIKSPDYKIKTDSLSYNMNTELATFFVPTNIWNVKGEILSADRGKYDKVNSYYHFTKNSYILTDKQELWADTIDYYSPTENAVLFTDIQMRDDSNKVIAFGDYGQYWGDREEAMLTKRPSLVSFDPEQDSIFIRSDSMFLYTISRAEATKLDAKVVESDDEMLIVNEPKPSSDSTTIETGEPKAVLTEKIEQPDQRELEQSLDADGQQVMTKKQKRQLDAEKKRLEKVAKQMGDGRDVLKAEGGGDKSDEKDKDSGPDKGRDNSVGDKDLRSNNGGDTKDGVASDSTTKSVVTDLANEAVGTINYTLESPDSLKIGQSKEQTMDSLAKNLASENTILTDTTAVHDPADSMVRVVRGYFNVKIYRSDFQAVCDSLVGFSIDSTMHLYIDPVLWNENNQIKSEIIDVYSKNQQLDHAVFTGDPIMSSQVDSVRFNQIKGKVIETLFRDNEIYRTNVNGNGQTLYYMTDDADGVVTLTGFMVVESADITFMMADRQVEQIIWRGDPVSNLYPMEKIPMDQPQILPGFEWELDRKPTKDEVFDRSIKPSQREVYEAMSQPTFPLTDEIIRNRERMIKEGIWRDRNDKISVDVQSFIQGLGY